MPPASPENPDRPVHERVRDRALIEAALGRAVREALLRHKRAGNPVCEWRDGKVRWIPPEEIPDLGDGPR